MQILNRELKFLFSILLRIQSVKIESFYILQLSDWLGADLQNLLDEFESHIGVIT